jgi:hypothetical protein
MMRDRTLLCCVLVLLLSIQLVGCQTDESPSNVVAQAVLGNYHVVISVTGKVAVKRERWKEYAPALFGTLLQDGDLLKSETGAGGRIVCADLTLVSIPSGVGAVPCKSPKHSPDNNTQVTPRTGVRDDFPILLMPRKTKLLDQYPTIRWTPIGSAASYSVTILGPDFSWVSPDVISQTEIVYPQDAPVLVPGQIYKARIAAGARNSDEEGLPDLGFSILTSSEADETRARETQIRALDLDGLAKDFLVSRLYEKQGLYSEAILRLEPALNNAAAPAVVRGVGALYVKVDLGSLAEDYFRRSLQLSQEQNDLEGQALSAHELGKVYQSLGYKNTAMQYLNAAIAYYRKLGADDDVSIIERELEELR